MYKLDRTAFKIQSPEDAACNYSYWKDKSVEERLRAAWYLIMYAYRCDPENPPRLDRTAFQIREKRP